MVWDGMTYLRTCCCSRGWGYGGRERGTNEGKGVVHHGEGGRVMFLFFLCFFLFLKREIEGEGGGSGYAFRSHTFHLESFLEAMSTDLPPCLSTYLLPLSGMSSRESCYIHLFI